MRSGEGHAESPEGSVEVQIYGQTYNIRSAGDNEYIVSLAKYVDGKMREIASGTQTVDSLKVAILAALHIADEFHNAKDVHAQFDDQLGLRSSECSELLDRFLKHKDPMPQQELEMEQ